MRAAESSLKAHTPCMGTHVFDWGEKSLEKGPPEGLNCACGMFEFHYTTCECGCGRRIMSLRFNRRGSRQPLPLEVEAAVLR